MAAQAPAAAQTQVAANDDDSTEETGAVGGAGKPGAKSAPQPNAPDAANEVSDSADAAAQSPVAAAQAALNAAFLPATMLSGFVYEISSMPVPIQAVTYLIPARYFVSALQTLFQAGFVGHVLLQDLLFLILSAILFLGLTALRTARRLD